GRLGLIDFGLTKELPRETRLAFARLVVAAAARNPVDVMAAFEGLGVRMRGEGRPENLMTLADLFFGMRPERTAMAGKHRAALRQAPIEAIPGELALLGRTVGL